MRVVSVALATVYLLGRGLGSALINSNDPGAYLLPGTRTCKSPTGRRLVLHNNYRFPINVRLVGTESGDTTATYEVVADDNGKSRVVEVIDEEVGSGQTIASGGELGVCVAKTTISGSYIRIPFKIESEFCTTQAPAPQHFALFYPD